MNQHKYNNININNLNKSGTSFCGTLINVTHPTNACDIDNKCFTLLENQKTFNNNNKNNASGPKSTNPKRSYIVCNIHGQEIIQ